MPKKRMTKKQMQGNGVMDILKGVNKFLKKSKIISTTADAFAPVIPKKYRGYVSAGSKVAKQYGYGVQLPGGGGLRLAGQGRKKRVGRPRKK